MQDENQKISYLNQQRKIHQAANNESVLLHINEQQKKSDRNAAAQKAQLEFTRKINAIIDEANKKTDINKRHEFLAKKFRKYFSKLSSPTFSYQASLLKSAMQSAAKPVKEELGFSVKTSAATKPITPMLHVLAPLNHTLFTDLLPPHITASSLTEPLAIEESIIQFPEYAYELFSANAGQPMHESLRHTGIDAMAITYLLQHEPNFFNHDDPEVNSTRLALLEEKISALKEKRHLYNHFCHHLESTKDTSGKPLLNNLPEDQIKKIRESIIEYNRRSLAPIKEFISNLQNIINFSLTLVNQLTEDGELKPDNKILRTGTLTPIERAKLLSAIQPYKKLAAITLPDWMQDILSGRSIPETHDEIIMMITQFITDPSQTAPFNLLTQNARSAAIKHNDSTRLLSSISNHATLNPPPPISGAGPTGSYDEYFITPIKKIATAPLSLRELKRNTDHLSPAAQQPFLSINIAIDTALEACADKLKEINQSISSAAAHSNTGDSTYLIRVNSLLNEIIQYGDTIAVKGDNTSLSQIDKDRIELSQLLFRALNQKNTPITEKIEYIDTLLNDTTHKIHRHKSKTSSGDTSLIIRLKKIRELYNAHLQAQTTAFPGYEDRATKTGGRNSPGPHGGIYTKYVYPEDAARYPIETVMIKLDTLDGKPRPEKVMGEYLAGQLLESMFKKLNIHDNQMAHVSLIQPGQHNNDDPTADPDGSNTYLKTVFIPGYQGDFWTRAYKDDYVVKLHDELSKMKSEDSKAQKCLTEFMSHYQEQYEDARNLPDSDSQKLKKIEALQKKMAALRENDALEIMKQNLKQNTDAVLNDLGNQFVKAMGDKKPAFLAQLLDRTPLSGLASRVDARTVPSKSLRDLELLEDFANITAPRLLLSDMGVHCANFGIAKIDGKDRLAAIDYGAAFSNFTENFDPFAQMEQLKIFYTNHLLDYESDIYTNEHMARMFIKLGRLDTDETFSDSINNASDNLCQFYELEPLKKFCRERLKIDEVTLTAATTKDTLATAIKVHLTNTLQARQKIMHERGMLLLLEHCFSKGKLNVRKLDGLIKNHQDDPVLLEFINNPGNLKKYPLVTNNGADLDLAYQYCDAIKNRNLIETFEKIKTQLTSLMSATADEAKTEENLQKSIALQDNINKLRHNFHSLPIDRTSDMAAMLTTLNTISQSASAITKSLAEKNVRPASDTNALLAQSVSRLLTASGTRIPVGPRSKPPRPIAAAVTATALPPPPAAPKPLPTVSVSAAPSAAGLFAKPSEPSPTLDLTATDPALTQEQKLTQMIALLSQIITQLKSVEEKIVEIDRKLGPPPISVF